MARQHHTIIFVPHARARLRKWHFTNFQIAAAAGVFLLLNLAAGLFVWFHFQANINPAELARLRTENKKLHGINNSFEKSIHKLQSQLSDYEDRTRQLAIVAGIEGLTGTQPGVGGGTPLDQASDYDLSAMEQRAAQLTGQLDAVETKLEQRSQWISATPAISPVRGILTSGFGYRTDPLTHGSGVHQGIDIAADPGTPVQASADGIVVQSGVVGGLGKAVYLAHGYGVSTRYGHLSQIDVRPGQRVKRGDTVGRVGSTGRSTGYHLHYEVRLDGQPVNPLGYILDETDASF